MLDPCNVAMMKASCMIGTSALKDAIMQLIKPIDKKLIPVHKRSWALFRSSVGLDLSFFSKQKKGMCSIVCSCRELLLVDSYVGYYQRQGDQLETSDGNV